MKEDFSFNPARPKQRGNYMITNFVSNYDDLAKTSIEHMIKDMDKHIDFLEKAENRGMIKNIRKYFHLTNPIEWIFLFFLAIISTVFLLIIDKIISLGYEKRREIASSENSIFNFIFWVGTAVILFLSATCVGYFISADADGDGIPEMRTVLSGMNISHYFSFNAMVGKILGLFAILVGGASVGKVGPYVHISCIICYRLMKISYFSEINKSNSSKNNMLAAATAAGITLALGTPLGGVLFSIECTASIYIVSNIWKSFFCSVICIFVSKAFRGAQNILLVDLSGTKPISFDFEILIFIIEGVIGGIIGGMIATLVAKIVYIRRKSKINLINNRFRWAVIISLIVSIVTYYLDFLQMTNKEIFNLFFSNEESKIKKLIPTNMSVHLFAVFCFKFILSVLCLTVDCSAGVFGPIFAIGALFGRFYGHILKSLFSLSDEGIYSLVGAACVFSGSSHTISSALIIFEITGQTSYLAPLLLSTLIANITSQSLTMNIFDVFLVIKNLPHLPSLKSQAMYSLNSGDLMGKVHYLLETNKITIINSMTILSKIPKNYSYVIPIIDENRTIKYTLKVKSLYKYITNEYDKVIHYYNIKNQSNFNEFLLYIRKKFFSTKRSFFEQIIYKFHKLYQTIKDQQRLELVKSFEEESNWRLVQIFQDSIIIFI
jgi:H+/Cl- antiporter ClcA